MISRWVWTLVGAPDGLSEGLDMKTSRADKNWIGQVQMNIRKVTLLREIRNC